MLESEQLGKGSIIRCHSGARYTADALDGLRHFSPDGHRLPHLAQMVNGKAAQAVRQPHWAPPISRDAGTISYPFFSNPDSKACMILETRVRAVKI